MEMVPEEVRKAFEEIEKYDLKVNTVICTVCGCVVSFDEKSKPCEHLMELCEGL